MNESTIQTNICTFLSMITHKTGIVFFSVPNEGIMGVLTMFKVDKVTCFKIVNHFKKMGLLPGTGDIIIVWRGLAFCMEVKTATGKQSNDQKLFERNFIASGGKYEIARSLDQAKQQLIDWGIL